MKIGRTVITSTTTENEINLSTENYDGEELYNEVKTDLKVTMAIYHNKSQQNGIKFRRWEENPDFWFS